MNPIAMTFSEPPNPAIWSFPMGRTKAKSDSEFDTLYLLSDISRDGFPSCTLVSFVVYAFRL